METIAPSRLRELAGQLFLASNLPSPDAGLCAEIAVLQEMRGVRTHGLRRVPPTLERLINGQINVRPNRTVISDRGATTVLDGDYGVGALGCMDAMERAIAKARRFGVGIGIVINNNHFQSAAPYCLRAVDRGVIGIAFSNTQASMGYPGATGRVIGNGPFGFAVPTASDFPIVFDSAMTTSGGKLAQWIREGRPLPPELFGLDSHGKLSLDPTTVLHGGTPMPIGGHKGAGLAILIEILTGVLGGGAFLHGILPEDKRQRKEESDSQCCIAIDIEHFIPASDFRSRVTAFITDLKSNPVATGYSEIVLPGEAAQRRYKAASRNGVVLDDDVRQELGTWARKLGVNWPLSTA